MSLPQNHEEQYLMGDRAYREISSRLTGYPLAQQILQEVYDFYGHYLSYIESEDFTSTIFTINLQHEPIALKSAEIQLQLGTDLLAEALAHELLHLRLPMLGFPLAELIQIPFQLDYFAQDFLGMGHWVLNLIQHEINFQSFQTLGFDKNYFLCKLAEPIDYREMLFSRLPQEGYVAEVGFPWWCLEYLKYWMSARHGGSQEYMGYAQDALDWGSQLHPELRHTTAEMHRWFEKGAFKDPHQYPRQINWLLGLMRIPKFTGWVILEFSESKKPMAVRLESIGVRSDGRDRAMSVLPF